MTDDEILRLWRVSRDEIQELNSRFAELFLRVGALQTLLQQNLEAISKEAVDQRIDELRTAGNKLQPPPQTPRDGSEPS